MKILMVCLGNICRSPMAEGALKSKLKEKNIEAEVDSAGFEPFHKGDPPDPRAVETLSKQGIDISGQRSRLFRVRDFDEFDKIFVMDSINHADVMALARNDTDMEKVDYILNQVFPGEDREVPDPYHGGPDGFNKVWELLDKATGNIADTIHRKNLSS